MQTIGTGIVLIIVAVCVVLALAYWGFILLSLGQLAVQTKKDADNGNLDWRVVSFWTFLGTCILIGTLRGCD